MIWKNPHICRQMSQTTKMIIDIIVFLTFVAYISIRSIYIFEMKRLFIIFLFLVETCDCYVPIMGTNNYLNSLTKITQSTQSTKSMEITKIAKSTQITKRDSYMRPIHTLLENQKNIKTVNKEAIVIDTIILNIYKFKRVSFRVDSTDVIMKLKDTMKNIYYFDENGKIEKLLPTTIILSGSIKNVIACELDPSMHIDCILCKGYRFF